jgi:hypothetical protein
LHFCELNVFFVSKIKKIRIFVIMEKFGNIEIRVVGKRGNHKLSPDNYDVSEIIPMLEKIQDLLYPNSRKDRPTISYNIQEGSVKNVFKTGIQAIIGFSAILMQIQQSDSIDFLELKTAQAIEGIQQSAYKTDYSFHISTSTDKNLDFEISPKTKYIRTENVWAEAEFYFYGKLTNAGGKNKVNIHLDTDEFGLLTIDTKEDFLKNQKENLLYKEYGIRVVGKQNLETGEIDKQSLKLKELVDYSPKYDEDYIKGLIKKARKSWKGIDAEKWLNDLRGGYEA